MNLLLGSISFVSILVIVLGCVYVNKVSEKRQSIQDELKKIRIKRRTEVNAKYWEIMQENKELQNRYDRLLAYAERLAYRSTTSMEACKTLEIYVQDLEKNEFIYIEKMKNCYNPDTREFNGF